MSLKKLIASSIATFCLVIGNANAQGGEATFKQNCAACHSIGKGRLVGPDLKDVASRRKEAWIIKFVKGSQAFIKSGDADAKALFEEYKMIMPDQNLKDDEIKGVIAYITEQGGGATSAAAPTAEAPKQAEPAKPTTKAATTDVLAQGKGLFDGSVSFANGGPSCISCHNVNYPNMLVGGLLAKDLTDCFERLGGGAGISGILTSPPFPAMTESFKNNPLTQDEIDALVVFLEDANKQKAAPAGGNPLLVGGLIGFVVIFGLILLIWNKRKKSNVKQDILDRQIKPIN